MTDNKMDCDERVVSERDLIFNGIPCKVEIDVIDITSDADDSVASTSAFSNVSLSADADSRISNKTPLIFNEKYFKIIKKIGDTAHQRQATGIIASCQLCTQTRTIKGSLKITSNFIQHLKSKHHLQYEEYRMEKQIEAKKLNNAVEKKRQSTQCTFPTDGSSEKLAVIFNGHYFKIIERIGDTDHQRSACGIMAACQICPNNTKVKGSLRITSNFVQHLRSKHPEQFYKNYLVEKKLEGRRSSKNCKESIKYSPVTVGAFSSVSPSALSANVDSIETKSKSGEYEESIKIEDLPAGDAFSNISRTYSSGEILTNEGDVKGDLLIPVNAFSSVSSQSIPPANAEPNVSLSMPLIFNGKYFKIITKVGDTDHQRAAKCIIADCQLCVKPTTITGSLKTTSNFIEHLKREHRSDYETYLIEKITSENWPIEEKHLLRTNHSSAFSGISTHAVKSKDADSIVPIRNSLMFNGEYFKIIRKVGYTAHERAANGIIAVCQICKPNKRLKGSLKITSNFVQHLRRKHPARYETYLQEKAIQDKWSVDERQLSNNGSSSMSKCSWNTDDSAWKNIPIIFNGQFFKIIRKLEHTAHQIKTRGLIAACQICLPHKKLRGSLRIRSNFVEHLKRKHPTHYEIYLKKKNAKEKYRVDENERFSDDSSASTSEFSSPSNHSGAVLPNVKADPDENELKKEQDAQFNFNEKLLAFLGDSFSPLSMVENSSFRNLFGDSSLEVCSQRYVADRIDTRYAVRKTNIKDHLKNVSYVCTTADIWSSRKRFYFGYTCHWIDANLKRKSAALACRSLTGNTLVDQIASVIHSVNTDFGLDKEKVVCTITGNGSNFLKAFKEFGIKDNYEIDEDECDDMDSNDDIEFVSNQLDFCPLIPKHYKCGSHTLNEFATTDFTNVLKSNRAIYEIHQTSLKRCSSIWDKCNRPETVEITKNLLSRTLKTPNSACWNSLFDSLKHLIQCKQKLDDICLALGVSKFSTTELQYIEEYCSLMEPISAALEFLQNEKDIFYGYFLPILVSTKVKLHKLYEFGRLSYLRDMAKQMETALVKRFRNFFEISPECYDSVISAIACPSIKTRFIKPLRETAENASFEDLKLLFIRHAEEFQKEVELPAMPVPSGVHAYFDFDENSEDAKRPHRTYQLEVRKEVERYLEDEDCSFECLRRYPVIKKMFMKYNTPLPSSSPVERLFSFDGIANRQRRQHLSDKLFERLVFMGANKMVDFN